MTDTLPDLVGRTLAIAGLATVLATPVAVGLAYLCSRLHGLLKAVVETVLWLPLVLPPTAVGLLLLQWLDPDWVFTPTAAVLAAAVMALPLIQRAVQSGLEAVDGRLCGVARTLGHSERSIFLRVLLPLSWPSLLAGVLLGFCRALGEFGATILVAGNIPGLTQTLSLAIFQRTQAGRDDEARLLCYVTVALAFAALLASGFFTRRAAR